MISLYPAATDNVESHVRTRANRKDRANGCKAIRRFIFLPDTCTFLTTPALEDVQI